MMTSAKALPVGFTIALLLAGGTAQAQEACKPYVVGVGDHLRSIARDAYGDPDLYRLIFEANRDVIGEKADLILVGSTLNLPCKPGDEASATKTAATEPRSDATVDQAAEGLATSVVDPAKEPVVIVPEIPVAGSGDEGAATEVASTDETAPAATAAATATPEPVAAVTEASGDATAAEGKAVAPGDGPIRIVTGNGYAPFADEMLPGGGMFTQIVEMAIFRADPDLPYSLTFINDWQAHIDALLPSQAYDLSFPWMRPDCEAPETLSAGDLARCNDFVFSAPYYEVVDGFFAATDSDLQVTSEYQDLVGKRICRPEAYTTGVLEAQGLGADNITLTRPQEAEACFEALARGDVDLVSIDTALGDAILKHMGLSEKFRQNPGLTTISTLHVIAYKANARAVAMLKVLDQGVMEMNQSGEWWDIVSSALGTQ